MTEAPWLPLTAFHSTGSNRPRI